MKLKSFQVKLFRSIRDSQVVNVEKITPLIGENDSGKTNLLHALAQLNPIQHEIKVPQHTDIPNFLTSKTEGENWKPIVKSDWEMEEADKNELSKIWKIGKNISKVRVEKNFFENTSAIVKFEIPSELEVIRSCFLELIEKIEQRYSIPAKRVGQSNKLLKLRLELLNSSKKFSDKLKAKSSIEAILEDSKKFLESLNQFAEGLGNTPVLIRELIDNLSIESTSQKLKSHIIENLLPKFLYINEYPVLETKQNLFDIINSVGLGTTTKGIQNYIKLCEFAGIDLNELQRFSESGTSSGRNTLFNVANVRMTEIIENFWSNKECHFEFNIDKDDLNAFITSDLKPRTKIELDKEGFGFQTFLSLAVKFADNQEIGKLRNSIFLLDEPGLHLHAQKQEDLVNYFLNDIENQVLYTTHSPFMIPMKKLGLLRTVKKISSKGTVVSNEIKGEDKSLFPLQSALGYTISQSLFIDQKNLIVEGITDFMAVIAMSEFLNKKDKSGLADGIVVTPGNGTPKNKHLATWLSCQNLDVIVLFDYERNSEKIAKELVDSSPIERDQIILISDVISSGKTHFADIEDLFGLEFYEILIQECYSRDIERKVFTVKGKQGRLVSIITEALKNCEINFDKRKPLDLLSTKSKLELEKIITIEAENNFRKLFEMVNTKFVNLENTKFGKNSDSKLEEISERMSKDDANGEKNEEMK